MNSLIFEDTNLGGTPYRFAACEARDGVMIACHKQEEVLEIIDSALRT